MPTVPGIPTSRTHIPTPLPTTFLSTLTTQTLCSLQGAADTREEEPEYDRERGQQGHKCAEVQRRVDEEGQWVPVLQVACGERKQWAQGVQV